MKTTDHPTLRDMRLAKELTQSELAKKLGISRQALAGYERGKRIPDIITAYRMAAALGVSLDEMVELFTG